MSAIRSFAKKVLSLKLLEKVGVSLINYDVMINVLQGYFLSKAFHPSEACFFGETLTEKAVFRILPSISFESLNHKIDILINENSMPEMTD